MIGAGRRSPASTSATAIAGAGQPAGHRHRRRAARRTVVDHVFRNPHDRQLEGTFEYPLPTGASPSYFAMFLGQTRDTAAAALRPPRRQSAAARRRPRPPDAGTSSSSTSTAPTGARCRKAASSPRRRRSKPTRTSSAAASTRPCWNTPAATPSAAASSRSRQGLQPRHPRLRGTAARRAATRCSIAFRCPAASLTEMSSRCRPTRGMPEHRRSCPKDAAKEEGGGRLVFTRTWKDRSPKATSSSPARRPSRESRRSAAGRARTGRLRLRPRCGPT